MPIQARRLIRKLRGGAQSHLIEAGDGSFWVVKFLQNPQHRRILVNELVSSVFLQFLQISQPETAIVEVTREFLDENPEVHIQLGTRKVPIEPGWHFGSRFPGDPAVTAVYDFIPDALLHKVENLSHFLGILVFDKWMGNADARQSIFFRAAVRGWSAAAAPKPRRAGFVAQMMDHGFVLNGPQWSFVDSPMLGLYFRTSVYEKVRSLDDFQPWLDQVTHFPEEVMDSAYKRVPGAWVAGEEAEFEALFEKLLARRKRVGHLLEDCREGRINPFANWR
jgi:hypothetical protein